jgi:hypothetical protein
MKENEVTYNSLLKLRKIKNILTDFRSSILDKDGDEYPDYDVIGKEKDFYESIMSIIKDIFKIIEE